MLPRVTQRTMRSPRGLLCESTRDDVDFAYEDLDPSTAWLRQVHADIYFARETVGPFSVHGFC